MSDDRTLRPTISQQLGLSEDPNKPKHSVSHTGAQVIRLESKQPGLPTYHRRIANPVPLVCIAVGAFFILYGCLLAEVRGMRSWHILMNIGLPLCGPGLMAAAMFSFAEGNTFLAVFAGTMSGILGGYSMQFLPWTAIQEAYTEDPTVLYVYPATNNPTMNSAFGVFFLCTIIPIFVLFIGSVRTAVPISAATFLMLMAFMLQGISLIYEGSLSIQKAAAAFYFMTGIVFWYLATAILLQESKIKILPVFPLPRVD